MENLIYDINLHAHSLLSDGALLPSEVAVRYMAAGYKTIAITDHADYSNIKNIVKAIVDFTSHWPKNSGIKVLPGVELTHIPPNQFKPLAQFARKEGIKIIVGHGQTPTEPVVSGTNTAALQSDIDILAHPGYISDEDCLIAKKRGILLEVTTRSGHSQTNDFVIKQILRFKNDFILDHDSHEPEDIIRSTDIVEFALKLGLTNEDITSSYEAVKKIIHKREAK